MNRAFTLDRSNFKRRSRRGIDGDKGKASMDREGWWVWESRLSSRDGFGLALELWNKRFFAARDVKVVCCLEVALDRAIENGPAPEGGDGNEDDGDGDGDGDGESDNDNDNDDESDVFGLYLIDVFDNMLSRSLVEELAWDCGLRRLEPLLLTYDDPALLDRARLVHSYSQPGQQRVRFVENGGIVSER